MPAADRFQMSAPNPPAMVCLASYEKGHDFLRECERQGCRVFFPTSLSLKDKAQWPVEGIDEIFYMQDDNKKWDRSGTLLGIGYLARTQTVDRVVPLDDFDLEMAAAIRERLRLPCMGGTTTRYFRDKLAMRMKAREAGLDIPEFVHVLNYARIAEFMRDVPPPWVLNPRLLAGAIGIKKVNSAEEAWNHIHSLGDERSFYLLERYIPGDIFHVDSIVSENEIVFSLASGYGAPPLDVSHAGGVFGTRVLERGSEIEQALLEKNRRVLSGLGLLRGVAHAEFIHGRDDGKIYFLETAARVGGAHIADLVEAATGDGTYQSPPSRQDYPGLLVSLAKQERPDTSSFNDPEIVWRMNKEHHVGLIVRSSGIARVNQLLDDYARRVQTDFLTSEPSKERPTD